MIFDLLYFCVVILCVNRSRSSFILYRIVKRHSRQSNVRRIWTCADNEQFRRLEMDAGTERKETHGYHSLERHIYRKANTLCVCYKVPAKLVGGGRAQVRCWQGHCAMPYS